MRQIFAQQKSYSPIHVGTAKSYIFKNRTFGLIFWIIYLLRVIILVPGRLAQLARARL